MDADRRIRFVVSPILFLASLAWGAWFDPNSRSLIHQSSPNIDWANLIAIAAGAGLVVFVAGYVIGTLTYVGLRGAFCLFGLFHEGALSEKGLSALWARLRAPDKPDRGKELFAIVAFDHGVLREDKRTEGAHLWLVRRWSAFSIASTSAVGLIGSFVFGDIFFGIHMCWQWLVPVGAFCVALLLVAISSWRDTMRMLEFMLGLPKSAPEPTSS